MPRASRNLGALGLLGGLLLLFHYIFVNPSLSLPPPERTAAVDLIWIFTFNNAYGLLLPLLGFYALIRKRDANWKLPAVLGTAAFLATWIAVEGQLALFAGVLYGLTVFGIARLTADLMPRLVRGGNGDEGESGRLGRNLYHAYSLFGLYLGVGILFLWAADALGARAADPQLTLRLENSAWPVLLLLPVAIGLSAALYEEFVYRRLADVYLTRWTRSTVLTALLSSLLWSLTHLSYSVSPWYLRILELGLVLGPLMFWAYKRFGLLAAVTGHFLYNAFLVCFQAVQTLGTGYAPLFLSLLLPLLLLPLDKKKGLGH